MTARSPIPDPTNVIRLLKDFQRDTVEYVFRRLYLDENTTRRFLVADEVGLGKTMVARGVIALTLKHLADQGEIDRLDVVYVCSNGAIAQQNIRRLNVTQIDNVTLPTRLSLLPLHVSKLEESRVNFVSLTPGTSFQKGSRGGAAPERILLWAVLREHLPAELRPGLENALQCTVGRNNWLRSLREFDGAIDESLEQRFIENFDQEIELGEQLAEVCRRFTEYRRYEEITPEDSDLRYHVVSQLRTLMARTCVGALEPDLIILDEFQRFADLLHGDSDEALLAREFLNYKDPTGHHARSLLLSATPYRMVSLSQDEEDHYKDFIETTRFLFDGDEGQVLGLEEDLKAYRRVLLGSGVRETGDGSSDPSAPLRRSIEDRLRRVMVRTERVPATLDHTAMLEARNVPAELAVDDLAQMKIADRVARLLESQDVVEYWKSAPYLLNLMREYQLKTRLQKAVEDRDPAITEVVDGGDGALLRRGDFEGYDEVSPGNPRLRALVRDTVDRGLWKLLWLPPSQPYLEAGGAYAEVDPAVTKALVFSTWSVVPDAISALCSYEVERRMVGPDPEHGYFRLNEAMSAPLRFDIRDGRYSGQYSLMLFYPSPTLAALGDPLGAVEDGERLPLDPGVVRERVGRRIREVLGQDEAATGEPDSDAREEQSWYWRSVAHLDRDTGAKSWVRRTRSAGGWARTMGRERADADDGLTRHIEHFAAALSEDEILPTDPAPEDLIDVLTSLALGAPATCALRALHRVAPELSLDDRALLNAAAGVANAFRTLFDLSESILLLRQDDDRRYWERILHYGIDGNLQAVLDEYAHVLVESLGLLDADPQERVTEIGKEMQEALSLRTSRVSVDELIARRRSGRVQVDRFNLRTRFALRFAKLRDEREETLHRADTVRSAFNSPFRPFVLATTSVGQEGLDFHPYCHAVYHWNLPSNPVDLEQREGRVHRYKGHAVRKNIAQVYGAQLPDVHRGLGDPWATLFGQAVADRPEGADDLIPFWIYEEGDARIERRIPLIPLTREVARARRLIQSLATYRMVIGQPRQEDLLALLAEGGADGSNGGLSPISLRPPTGRGLPGLAPVRAGMDDSGLGTISRPQTLSAQRTHGSSGTERGNYLAFWTRFRAALDKHDPPVELPRPTNMNQMRVDFPAGRLAFGYSFKNRELACFFLFRGEDPVGLWRRTVARRDEVDDAVGVRLNWNGGTEADQGWAYLRVGCPEFLDEPRIDTLLGQLISTAAELFVRRTEPGVQ